ncbi:hypothetical protein HNP32_000632 [Brevundimonas bullata]|jgi:hypothetical protein|uniref:Uncharacterized protein n=1 Tax=Brevundimonas bullata TaxID=13160 RepID=A0A7W7IML6_9CAUL|nr:hypothetical protein [Brevundimonas bullata]MBB4796918.1 hypothetical protein [Brevundimonas bullata]MBB6381877.1 hypothetical protein [Brevundimonas bullata]
MDYIYSTHKEPAWGWIGALLDARKAAAPVANPLAAKPAPRLRPRRAAA